MKLNKYLVKYRFDPDPIFEYSCTILATSVGAAKNHFYKTHTVSYYTILNVYEYIDDKEKKKMDLTKKITVSLTEDDVKEIVADYIRRNSGMTAVTAENVEMVYGVKYSGPQMDRVEHGYLMECKIKG